MTQAILDVRKQIRRALQGALYTAVKTAGYLKPNGDPAIQWGALPFDRLGLDNYFAVQISVSGVNILEVGQNPMAEGAGHITINCHSPLSLGEDGNDVLQGIVALAYPYASTPSFGGVSVFIDKATPGSYGSDGPYMTGLVTVDWNIYRRP